MVYKVKVSYSNRDDISFTLGAANKPYAESPTFTIPSTIANNQGGNFPMQGAGASSEIEMAFNFTDYINKIEHFDEPKFFLDIICGTKGIGYISQFSVLNIKTGQEWFATLPANTTLSQGKNIFAIATTEIKTTSASPIEWLDNNQEPIKQPIVFKTANGNYAKVLFRSYDKTTGKITMKYLYQPQKGNTDLHSN